MNFKKKGLVLSSALMMVSLVLPTTSALAQIQTESANENSKPTDEEYADFISNEIDTLDGEEEKEKEDAYLDEAEKAYNEALKEKEDKKTEDKKSEDKKSEDKKSEDKRSEDKKTEDKRSEDKKSEDKRSEDKKSEDKRSEDKKSKGKKQVKRILPKTSAVK